MVGLALNLIGGTGRSLWISRFSLGQSGIGLFSGMVEVLQFPFPSTPTVLDEQLLHGASFELFCDSDKRQMADEFCPLGYIHEAAIDLFGILNSWPTRLHEVVGILPDRFLDGSSTPGAHYLNENVTIFLDYQDTHIWAGPETRRGRKNTG
jgi:hypothetical protein